MTDTTPDQQTPGQEPTGTVVVLMKFEDAIEKLDGALRDLLYDRESSINALDQLVDESLGISRSQRDARVPWLSDNNTTILEQLVEQLDASGNKVYGDNIAAAGLAAMASIEEHYQGIIGVSCEMEPVGVRRVAETHPVYAVTLKPKTEGTK